MRAGSVLIKNGQVVFPDKVMRADVLVCEGNIRAIGKDLTLSADLTISADRFYVAPGFIDLHVNGGLGSDFSTSGLEDFLRAVRFHNHHGTVGLLPTCVPLPVQKIRSFLQTVKLARRHNPSVLGAHLNGPFVSPAKSGAMVSEYLLPSDPAKLCEVVSGYEDVVKVMTIAPELPGAEDLVKAARDAGIILSVGHSDASFEDVLRARSWGVQHFTHFYNALSGFHHREPGAVGAGWLVKDMTLAVIADGYSVHPAAIRLLTKLRGYSSICLVTDATSAAGMPDGRYALGNATIIKEDGKVTTEEGMLSGTACTMDQVVRNFLAFTGANLFEGLRCASLNPASVLGVAQRKGSIEEGKDADLVLLDENLVPKLTLIQGEIVYEDR